MKPEHLEALGALFDGERVDPSLLAEALADPRAADVLADHAGLRLLAREDRPEPSEDFYARMAPILNRRTLGGRIGRLLLPAAAAALVLVSGAGGYVLRAALGPAAVVAVAPPPTPLPQAPVVLSVPSPVPPPEAPARNATLRKPGAPPASALRLRFQRWQETTPGLEQRPE